MIIQHITAELSCVALQLLPVWVDEYTNLAFSPLAASDINKLFTQ